MHPDSRPLAAADVCHAANLVEALAALRSSRTRWLVANGKGFGDAEALKIARFLQNNKTLEQLSLAGNRIGPAGAEALGEAVGANSSLKELYLQRNRIGQQGIELFAASIQSAGASRLEVFNVSSNGLGRNFPPGLALTSLRSLIVKNNNIQELPSCYGECERLSEVILDNNPLVFPPADLYVSHGWYAIRSHLVKALSKEQQQNCSVGLGGVSNHRRDQMLLAPVRKLMTRGALQDAAIALEKARSVYVRLNAAAEVAECDELARRMLALLAMDDASAVFPAHLDCCFRVEGAESSSSGFLMSRSLIAAKAPFLSSFACDHGFDAAATVRGRNALRKVVDVGGTSRAGLRCFLAFLLLDNLTQAAAVSARLENLATHDHGVADEEEDDDDDEEEEEEDEKMSKGKSACEGLEVGAAKKRAQGGVVQLGGRDGGILLATGQEGESTEEGLLAALSSNLTPTPTDDTERGQRQAEFSSATEEEAEGEEAAADELSGELRMLFDVTELGERFGVEGLAREAERVVEQRLRPRTVIAAVKAAKREGREGLKGVCLRYLEEHAESIDERAWHGLGGDCRLLMEVMTWLGQGDSRPDSPRWTVSTALMQELLRRLDGAERKAERQRQLCERIEASLLALQPFLSLPAVSPPSSAAPSRGVKLKVGRKAGKRDAAPSREASNVARRRVVA